MIPLEISQKSTFSSICVYMKGRFIVAAIVTFLCILTACEGDKEHMAPAVSDSDSIPFMNAHGISTLISDSGVIRYKIVAEEWQIFNTTNPATWTFKKGFFMERYDENMHVNLFVQADTAYLREMNTWELRGRVVVKNLEGTLFLTEELFWDMGEHNIWNHMPMDIFMPDRELHGTDFRSNESMTDYFVTNSTGALPSEDMQSDESEEENDD